MFPTYVTYELEGLNAGQLTGSYIQEVHPAHLNCHILCSEYEQQNWTLYEAAPDRKSLVLKPQIPVQE